MHHNVAEYFSCVYISDAVKCLRLWNASRSVSTEVVILDQCPVYYNGGTTPQSCARYNWLDISPDAWNEIGGASVDSNWGEQQVLTSNCNAIMLQVRMGIHLLHALYH